MYSSDFYLQTCFAGPEQTARPTEAHGATDRTGRLKKAQRGLCLREGIVGGAEGARKRGT